MEKGWKEFDRMIEHFDGLEPGTKEYDTALDQFNKVVHIVKKLEVGPLPPPSRLDKFLNNQALVSGILMFGLGCLTLYHERAEVITSSLWNKIRFR